MKRDPLINLYDHIQLQRWRANVDLKFILLPIKYGFTSLNTVLSYIKVHEKNNQNITS
jgi:hypothetical protein